MIKNLIGVQRNVTSHKEKIISAVGGFIGIYLTYKLTRIFIGDTNTIFVVASMGASAVLLFAVPHGTLSQPWPVLGGHVICAIIGTTVHLYVSEILLASGLAVGISIAGMYYMRCIHPPACATALMTVFGGSEIYALGYNFVLMPVLINAVILLLLAFIINYPFVWRRYPVALSLSALEQEVKHEHGSDSHIPRRDLHFALRSIQSFADITEVELERIYRMAKQHSQAMRLKAEDIKLGHYYIHGKYGEKGVIRRIIDESISDLPNKDMVIYKVISGSDELKTDITTREKFARWAKYEVIFENNTWKILEHNKVAGS